MNDNFRSGMVQRLSQKETDELLQIWQANDRVEWTPLAFDVIRDILQERSVELPPQNEPVYQHIAPVKEESAEEEELPESGGPVLYDPGQVLWLHKWINRAAIAFIILVFITNLFFLPGMQRLTWSFFRSDPGWQAVSWVLGFILMVVQAAMPAIVIYFPLKALASILRILMQMEVNSRSSSER